MCFETCLPRRVVLALSLGLVLAGCGQQPDVAPIPADLQGLRELAALYRDFARQNRRGPKDLAELQGLTQGKGKKAAVRVQAYPNAERMVASGEIVVQWGAPLAPAEAVLAYVRTVPEQGGSVLLQDGETVKTVTAADFKNARKAPGR